ncbi:MAG: hypothetical protein GXO33_03900 [Epsilonproteobacteria bacterium]|nr:hypothetical protein [Campylobacterota bacterium]
MIKKYFTLIALIGALFFAGCGGGNGDANGDGPEPLSNITFSVDSASASGGYGEVVLNIESNQTADITVQLQDFRLGLTGFSFSNVTAVPYPMVFVTSCTQKLRLAFNYAPSSQPINLEQMKVYFTKVVKSNLSDSVTSTEEMFALCCPTAVSPQTYTIKALPDNIDLQDTNGSITVNIDVVVQDANGEALENEGVTADLDSTMFGTLDKYHGTTDTEGKITFVYTSPDKTDDIKGRTVPINIWVDKDPNTKTAVYLHF